jgi:pimeloyl-ACP methyl ester carboxylesterase
MSGWVRARFCCWVVCILAAIVASVHVGALGLEDRLLLHPKRCRAYVHYPPRPASRWRSLPSGGLVVTLDRSNSSSSGDDERGAGRELLFCHGNAGNLDDFEGMARRLADRGYRVRLLEYSGFGAAKGQASGATVLRDATEAWKLCVRQPRRAILAGFSLGGGAVTQLLALLPEDRLPGQVLLINTFFSLPDLVREKVMGSAVLARMMRTRWCAGPGLRRFSSLIAQRRKASWPRTVIIATADDALIGPRHAEQLEASAKPDVQLAWMPSGGHGSGPVVHWATWTAFLPPP